MSSLKTIKAARNDKKTTSTFNLLQIAHHETGQNSSGTQAIPLNNSAPIIDQGTEFMVLKFKAHSPANKLIIEVLAFHSIELFPHTLSRSANAIGAVFLDGQRPAIASTISGSFQENGAILLSLKLEIIAGSMDLKTFRYRAGPVGDGTLFFNSISNSAILDGTLKSRIQISEYEV